MTSLSPHLVKFAVAVALMAGTALLYAKTLPYPFLNLDDPVYVTENPHVYEGLTADNAWWGLTTGWQANWHPLTWWSLQLDATLFGTQSATGFRAVNIALHAANAALVFLVLTRMTGAVGRSAAVAVLFAVHPLRVESVVWVSERKDVLSGFFGLLALWAYLRYAERPSAGRMLGVVGLMALSLAGKPMLVTLPCVCMLLDYWPLRRAALPTRSDGWGPWFVLAREKWPLFALAVVWSVVAWVAQSQFGATIDAERLPLPTRAANALLSAVAYLRQTVWPAEMAVFYPHEFPSLADPRVLLAAAVLAAITGACVRLARSRPYMLVGWLWFLGTLVPVIGLVQVGCQGRADRYTYLPQIGLLVAAVWGVWDIVKQRGASAAVVVIVAGVFAAVNWQQSGAWRTQRSVWEHTLSVTGEENFKAQEFMAGAMLHDGDYEGARRHAELSLRIEPLNSMSLVTLGDALMHLGKPEEAIVEFQKGVQQAPNTAFPRWMLGKALLETGRAAEALPYLKAGGESDQCKAAESIIAGRNLLDRQMVGPARELFERALKLFPNLAEATFLLGTCDEAEGKFDAAISRYREAIRQVPEFASPYARLGLVLDHQGDHVGAVEAAGKAVALRPNSPVYRTGLGQVLTGTGKSAEADAQYAEATRLAPDWPDAAATAAFTILLGPNPKVGTFEARCKALQACQGTAYKKSVPLAALAAVEAADGKFADAEKLARKAADLAEQPELAKEFRDHADLYKAGRILRDRLRPGG